MEWTQNFNNLPEELLQWDRFIPVRSNKIPFKGWDNSKNWKRWQQVQGKKGFVLDATPYLVLDYDHIKRSADGEIDPAARLRLNEIREEMKQLGGTTYGEWSCSRCGIHEIYKPDTGYIGRPIAGDAIDLTDDHTSKDRPRIELWFGYVHQFIFTGDLLDGVDPRQSIVSGERANAVFDYLSHNLTNRTSVKDSAGPTPLLEGEERTRLLNALYLIPASINRAEWIKVGCAMKNAGLTLEDWETWSATCPEKYVSEGEGSCSKEWPTLHSRWNAGTIYRMAKEYTEGYRFRPEAFTDLGQAQMFADRFGDEIKYSRATRWIVYNGKVWDESEELARCEIHNLLRMQKEEARTALSKARNAQDLAVDNFDESGQREAKRLQKDAEKYIHDVMKYEQSGRISATMTEAAPKMLLSPEKLDHDPYKLNTPDGTIDLHTGNLLPHKAEDYCTKITGCGMSDKGTQRWGDFLDKLTDGDNSLKEYLQQCMGLAAIGEVKQEKMIIAYGEGGNGKSTFFNVVQKVLGNYAGSFPSEVLTTGHKTNSDPFIARLRGQRLTIAAELREEQRLDTAMVKRLCSTDAITGKKLYKDPFDFFPSHTVVLFTNHLPQVGTNDSGTWDRIIVVPFTHRFRGTSGEVKDYASVLFSECGGAVLRWIVEGARCVIKNRFKITAPDCVLAAIEEYRSNNDWVRAFLDARCTVDPTASVSGGELTEEYAAYCRASGEYHRSASDLRAALVRRGFEHRRTKDGAVYYGLKIRGYQWTG